MSSAATPTVEFLTRCYRAAVAAVEPRTAMLHALTDRIPGPVPIVVIAVGKAAHGMASGLTEWLRLHDREPALGLLITPVEVGAPHPRLEVAVGDHPMPATRSLAASARLASLLEHVPPDAEVHMAISGGASALMAGPLPGLAMADVVTSFDALLGSGLDIHQVNAVRKRLTRWSAGRLALALSPRRVLTWVISDVPGDLPSTIASGPCTGDPWTTDQVRDLCRASGLLDHLPPSVVEALGVETPKPSEAGFNCASLELVGNNRQALTAAAVHAEQAGFRVEMDATLLTGAADVAGREIARRLTTGSDTAHVLLLGGETTVALDGASGRGGRNQELALAAAEVLATRQAGVTLLAAGTDGRDGPTDAAGAVVDGSTWSNIAAAGIDPSGALRGHDAYPALDAAGALLRTGATGTNVMDVVIALRE